MLNRSKSIRSYVSYAFFFGKTSNSNCNKLNSIQPIEKCETQNCASVKAARGKIAITLVHTHQGCNFENVFCDGLFFLSPFCYSFADGCHLLLTFHILVRLVDFHLFIGTYLHCFIFFVFSSLKLFFWNVKWNRKKKSWLIRLKKARVQQKIWFLSLDPLFRSFSSFSQLHNILKSECTGCFRAQCSNFPSAKLPIHTLFIDIPISLSIH